MQPPFQEPEDAPAAPDDPGAPPRRTTAGRRRGTATRATAGRPRRRPDCRRDCASL